VSCKASRRYIWLSEAEEADISICRPGTKLEEQRSLCQNWSCLKILPLAAHIAELPDGRSGQCSPACGHVAESNLVG
jgi:hypothetical protein